MPRTTRTELAGAIHHVTARSPSRRLLFHDDRDRGFYLARLAQQIEDAGWSLYSYCLMSNHTHLLLKTPAPNLGAGLKALHEEFATFVNRRREENGHVFGARFNNRVVQTNDHFSACLRYIARNPVAAGVCTRASDWSWSAHQALAGLAPAPSFLDVDGALALLGRGPHGARVAYVQSVVEDDAALVAHLAREDPTGTWMTRAVDDHLIPVPELATHLGIGTSTAYRRLVSARRENEGTVP